MLISSCQKEGGKEKELSEKELLEKVILGKWVRNLDTTDGSYLDFLSDNTYISLSSSSTSSVGTRGNGKWTILDDGRLKMEQSSGTYVWEIIIEGDNAGIGSDGMKLFVRAK
ncbi:hypothetical protein N9Z81_00340 [bacterium]|nr:hypothetical protein [bacterium]